MFCTRPTYLVKFYSTSSPKQLSRCRFGHNIPTPSQQLFFLTRCGEEATNRRSYKISKTSNILQCRTNPFKTFSNIMVIAILKNNNFSFVTVHMNYLNKLESNMFFFFKKPVNISPLFISNGCCITTGRSHNTFNFSVLRYWYPLHPETNLSSLKWFQYQSHNLNSKFIFCHVGFTNELSFYTFSVYTGYLIDCI